MAAVGEEAATASGGATVAAEEGAAAAVVGGAALTTAEKAVRLARSGVQAPRRHEAISSGIRSP